MPVQGGLAQMLSEQGGADEELVSTAREIESMPGGSELLYTFAAEELMKAQGIPKKDYKKIRLYQIGGYVKKQRGGSVHGAADRTRRAGRGDDSIMLHMSPEEAEVISSMWGPPEINPKTGIGEYGFLSNVWKKLKKGVKKVVKSEAFAVIAPIALAIFVPGLGAAIGGALAPALGAGAQAMIGSAVVQGGLGAITGGKEGAIKGVIGGAIAGGAGGKLGAKLGMSGKTADVVGTSLLKGMGAEATGGDFASGALEGALTAGTASMTEQFAESARGAMGLQAQEGDLFASRIPKAAPAGGLEAAIPPPAMSPTPDRPVTAEEMLAGVEGPRVERTASPMTGQPVAPKQGLGDLVSKYGIPALTALGAMQGGGDDAQPPQLPAEFTESLPVYTMNRKFRGMDPSSYFTYGQAGAPQSGQHLFLAPEPFAGVPDDPSQGPPGGLEGVAGAPTQQPVALQPGRAGHMQRRQLETQGWTYDPASQMMYPPEATAAAPGPAQAPGAGNVGTGSTSFVARGGYQRGGEFDYWQQNDDVFDTTGLEVSARGRYVKGDGHGREDAIPAKLSDGEYVIDAESVSLLGNGSGDAGARRLDEMRSNLRKHKGKQLTKGEFSHKAKSPENYMRNKRKLRRRANYEHGGLHNVASTSPASPVSPAVGGNA